MKKYLVTVRYTNYEIECRFFSELDEAKVYYNQIVKSSSNLTLSEVLITTDNKAF
jgi:hypothetical protein